MVMLSQTDSRGGVSAEGTLQAYKLAARTTRPEIGLFPRETLSTFLGPGLESFMPPTLPLGTGVTQTDSQGGTGEITITVTATSVSNTELPQTSAPLAYEANESCKTTVAPLIGVTVAVLFGCALVVFLVICLQRRSRGWKRQSVRALANNISFDQYLQVSRRLQLMVEIRSRKNIRKTRNRALAVQDRAVYAHYATNDGERASVSFSTITEKGTNTELMDDIQVERGQIDSAVIAWSSKTNGSLKLEVASTDEVVGAIEFLGTRLSFLSKSLSFRTSSLLSRALSSATSLKASWSRPSSSQTLA